jgi:glycogen debranching enzyme
MKRPAGTDPSDLDLADATEPFYIRAVTGAEPSPRALKHGNTFALFDHRGDIVADKGRHAGLYHRDTRMLSDCQLFIDRHRPLLLSSTVQDDNAALTADLTNPDVFSGDQLLQAKDTLHITRTIFLWDRACHQRIALRNFSHTAQTHTLVLAFAADFADIFEVRGHEAVGQGARRVQIVTPRRVDLHYTARDGDQLLTTLELDPVPADLSTGRAIWRIELAAGAFCSVFVRVSMTARESIRPDGRTFFSCMRAARTAVRRSSSRMTSIETSNAVFNEMIRRSVADLHMLITDLPTGPYPYAGIPWFSTVFGRDGIITAMATLWADPAIARGVLMHLAATQALRQDAAADAAPGKILHEMRLGELARIGAVPFAQYYGSVDATPLFVLLAGRYHERSGDNEAIAQLWPHIEAALAWIATHGDPDQDGLVEYLRQGTDGLVNQGWKDSGDAVFHADGELAQGPIALAEVQGYVYAAKRNAARMARTLGRAADAGRLQREARQLRQRFEESFWSDEIDSYVMALDGRKQPCLVRSSNAGQVLLSGIAAPERAARVARHMLSARFFSGWGIRTIAKGEARYNPMSYHNGSVWPHDNALIAAGLARYGHKSAVLKIFQGLFDAASYSDLRRLPELFCGFHRKSGQGPTFYPVACSPQAWASAAPLALLQASLGLGFHPATHSLSLNQPRLPAFLDEVRLKNLRLGSGCVDLLLRRHGNDVAVNVLRREGDIVVDVRV